MDSSAGSPATPTTTTTTNTTTIGKRLLRIVRTVYYLLRKGIPKSKLIMDLHLLLKRGKLAGKALTTLLTLFHHHHHHHQTTSDEVQLSCTNTPNNSHPFINYFHAATAKKRTSRRRPQDDSFDAAAIATAFEIMNAGFSDAGSPNSSAFPTPSPMLMGPMMVRKLRITDSPFPIVEESGDGGKIDRAADEFIRNFYEQLRCQQLASAAATPDQYFDDHRRTRT